LKQGEIAGYTDTENPFGDANLTERFVWHKKIEKSLLDGVDAEDLGVKAEKVRHEARLLEIEKVKMQREQRDREKMEKELEREMVQREEALIEAVELEKKEEEFHVAQAKLRSDIRVKEGRARAIDLVARNVDAEVGKGTFDHAVRPLDVFQSLSTRELQELRDDVSVRLDLAKRDSERREFWRDFLVVTDAELASAKRRDAADRARVRGKDPVEAAARTQDAIDRGVHDQVDADVSALLEGKSLSELERLRAEVSATMREPDAPEIEYWQAVLRRLDARKARVSIEDADRRMRAKHGEVPPAPSIARGEASDDEDLLGAAFGTASGGLGEAPFAGEEESPTPERFPERSPEPADRSGSTPEGTPDREYSPALLDASRVPEYAVVVDPDEDARRLAASRAEVRRRNAGFAVGRGKRSDGVRECVRDVRAVDASRDGPGVDGVSGARAGVFGVAASEEEDAADAAAAASRRLAEKMMGENDGAEVAFAGEARLESQAYWWHDKFRPRKPKYFNRVHTGYDWNKYNQTHYDHDNPPPKTVQGYKFNLFYPDLIDKTKAPSYSVAPDGSRHGETCILRISAGPPYEDIAFKIVNKEWEYSSKRGFKCSFERGIFHLYINFKRPRYRR